VYTVKIYVFCVCVGSENREGVSEFWTDGVLCEEKVLGKKEKREW
jgi:hypothetical protein